MNDAEVREQDQPPWMQFWTAFRAAPIGMAILNSDGVVVNTNDTLDEMFGEPSPRHRPLAELVREDDRERFAGLLSSMVEGRVDTAETELTMIGAKERTIIVALALSIVRGVFGRPRYMIAMLEDITERKDAEQALRESEERFRALADSAYEGIIITRDGVILEVNQALLDMTGYSRSDLIGTQALDLTATHSLETVVKHAIEGSEASYEAEFRKKDGTPFLAEVRGKPLIYKGEPARVGALVDITERKRAEQALRESEEKYRTLFEASPDAIIISDPYGHILSVNPAAQAMFGRTEEELCRIGRAGVITPEDHRIEALLEERARTGHTRGAVTYIRKDGSRFEGEMNSVLLPEMDRAFVFIRDITEQVRARDALRETERDMKRAQAVAKTGSWRLDTIRDKLHWSEESYRIFGVPLGAEMTYETFLDRVHPEDREYVDREWKAAMDGAPYDIEHRICVNDETKWVRETAELEFDPQGRLLGGFGTVRDITDQKQAEQALHRALEESQRDRRFIGAMEGVSEAAISAGSLDEVLQSIAVRIREGMGSHSCTLFLLDQEKQELEAVAACNVPEELGFRLSVGQGFVGKILQEKRTIYVRDVGHDPLVVSPHVRRAHVKSILGTPLIGRRGAVGVVYVDEQTIREFTPEEQRLLETLAARTALVIENAQLTDEVARNFSLLQRALLPPKPEEIPGYGVAAVYRPGARGAEIGGDFYDVFHTENGSIGIMIGDVVGKGIPSASLAASTRSTLRAFIYDSASPKEALGHTNAVIGPEKEDPSLFVTAHVAVLDPDTGRIRHAGAGHPPPVIHRHATGQVEFIREGNPPVGVLDTYEFEQWETRLAQGDKIVFYTDGIDEARRGPLLFGLEGIERILRETGDRPPQEVLDALLSAALDWAQGPLQDDAAIIVIERK